jgi:hypothetical protein
MRKLPYLAGILWLIGAAAAGAIEFKPFPTARVTVAQWQGYFDDVKKAHGASAQEFKEQRLVVFQDNATVTSYAFTLPGHAAHPAWVARRVTGFGGEPKLDTIGYFAGDETAFAELFRQYQALNQRMMEDLKRQKGAR